MITLNASNPTVTASPLPKHATPETMEISLATAIAKLADALADEHEHDRSRGTQSDCSEEQKRMRRIGWDWVRLRQNKAAAFRRGDDREEPECIFRRHTESLTKAVLARAAIIISTCNNAATIPGGCFRPRLLVADECGQ